MGLTNFFTGKNVKDNKSTQGGKYFSEGNYLCQIIESKMIETRQSGPAFVVNFKIITSDNENLKPGQEAAFFVMMNKDAALGNVNYFMGAAYSMVGEVNGEPFDPDNDLTDELCNYAISDENPFAGYYLNVYAYDVETRNGGTFTRHKFSTPDNIKELMASIAA